MDLGFGWARDKKGRGILSADLDDLWSVRVIVLRFDPSCGSSCLRVPGFLQGQLHVPRPQRDARARMRQGKYAPDRCHGDTTITSVRVGSPVSRALFVLVKVEKPPPPWTTEKVDG